MNSDFSSDRPIRDESEDILGRADFAKNIAKSILNWNDSESLVIGIYGAWGDGKSSTKNLISNQINKDDKDSLMLDFNPWQWGSEEKISKAFFQEILRVLKKDKKKDYSKLIKTLKRYSDRLDIGTEVSSVLVEKFQWLVFFASIIFAFVGIRKKIDWLYIIALVFLILSQITKAVSYCLKIFLRWYNSGQPEDETLSDQKKSIRDLLVSKKQKIYVMIDDLDRLTKEEIRSVFKLVKANADFPGIVYMLYFQRDIIEKAVSESDVYEGREYLKKIVQVGFDLPKISNQQLTEILVSSFNECLEKHNFLATFSQARWYPLFDDGVKHYFSNMRDINRFLSTYKFQLKSVIVDGHAEVNFVDLVGLEALRVFEPDIYNLLPLQKELLTKYLVRDEQRVVQKLKEEIEDIFNERLFVRKKSAKKILQLLFPNVEWPWGKGNEGNSSADFVSNRINHPDKFDIYFRSVAAELNITKSEMIKFIEDIKKIDSLRNHIEKYKKNGKLEQFVNVLQNYKETIPVSHLQNFLAIMFEVGDDMSDDIDDFLDNPLIRVERIIHWSFIHRRMKLSKKDIFFEAINLSTGIYIPLNMIFKEIQRHKYDQYPDHFIFSVDDKKMLEEKFIERINLVKEKEIFCESYQLPTIISQWQEIQYEDAKKWVDNYTKDEKRLASYLNRMIYKGWSSSGYETKIKRRISLHWLKTLGEPGLILSKIEELNLESRFSDLYPYLKEGLNAARAELIDPDIYRRIMSEDDAE